MNVCVLIRETILRKKPQAEVQIRSTISFHLALLSCMGLLYSNCVHAVVSSSWRHVSKLQSDVLQEED